MSTPHLSSDKKNKRYKLSSIKIYLRACFDVLFARANRLRLIGAGSRVIRNWKTCPELVEGLEIRNLGMKFYRLLSRVLGALAPVRKLKLAKPELKFGRKTCFFVSLFLVPCFLFLPNPANAANINFSLEAWLKPTTSIATKAILVKNNEIRLVTDASGYLVCQIHNGADWQTAANSGAAIELNKWSQAGCSYDGLNLKVYINGVLKGTTAMTADAQNTTNKFFAGYDSSGGGYGRFSGTMDSIAIYKDALTAQEFADHYSRGNLYKDENNNLKFEIGNLNLSYDISSVIFLFFYFMV